MMINTGSIDNKQNFQTTYLFNTQIVDVLDTQDTVLEEIKVVFRRPSEFVHDSENHVLDSCKNIILVSSGMNA